ncbi:MAG: hypothetical protein CME06_16605 [Gemmatimonadetes bacterium]|nr:hypothetical protein [Gemmatimonadota bacterium]
MPIRNALPFALACAAVALVCPADAATLTACLESALATAPEDEPISINLRMHAQLDLSALSPYLEAMRKTERRMVAIRAAKDLASNTQAPLLEQLSLWVPDGAVFSIRTSWGVNEINVTALPRVARALAHRSDLAHLGLNVERDESILADVESDEYGRMNRGGDDALSNLDMIDAPEAWAMGFEGQGVVIANIDTGTDRHHSDYASRIWENPGEIASNATDDDGNGYIDDLWGWDFDGDDNDPGYEESSHGTHTAGILVGDGTAGTITGVAPRGTMLVLRSCNSEFDARSAYEYALANGADIISSSCSYKFPDCPDYAAFRQLSELTAAGGLFHTNSIGNLRGQNGYAVPYNISAPANAPAAFIHPDQTLVGSTAGVHGCGAVDSAGELKHYSAEGPAEHEAGSPSCGPQYYYDDYPYDPEMGLIKPDYVAPTDVTTTRPGGGYTYSFGGTSAATPHSGGVAAVILSAIPDATPAQLSEAMQMTAVDRGPAGKDNDYGAGILDLDDAIGYLLKDLTIALSPPALQIAQGGEMSVRAEIYNNTADSISFELRAAAYLSDGTPCSTNPVLGPRMLTIEPGELMVKNLAGTVDVPPGIYTVEGIVSIDGADLTTDTFVFGVTR